METNIITSTPLVYIFGISASPRWTSLNLRELRAVDHSDDEASLVATSGTGAGEGKDKRTEN